MNYALAIQEQGGSIRFVDLEDGRTLQAREIIEALAEGEGTLLKSRDFNPDPGEETEFEALPENSLVVAYLPKDFKVFRTPEKSEFAPMPQMGPRKVHLA